MKKKEGSNLKLIVDPNEAVTLEIIKSIKLVDKVSYSLNGGDTPGDLPKSQPCTFGIDATSDLAVTVFFAENDGASFTIQVKGSNGGDVATFSDTQATDEAFQTVGYTLFLGA